MLVVHVQPLEEAMEHDLFYCLIVSWSFDVVVDNKWQFLVEHQVLSTY